MPRRIHTYAGHTVTVDDEGYLTDPSQWLPEMADEIAHDAGIDRLTPAHWKVITLCREDAARTGRTPGAQRLSDVGGVDLTDLQTLFPNGPGNLAARIAGLPKPPTQGALS